jgi:hypothetical protein
MKSEKTLNKTETQDHESGRFDAFVSLQPPDKVDLFGPVPIRSISFDETEIIEDILRLHIESGQIDLDPTYSTGNFYKKLRIKPKHKYDICPQVEGVLQSDCRKLPFGADELDSIMFDPPFVVGSHNEGFKTGIIKDRFSYYKNIPELWQFYSDAMKEFYRILAPNGVLVFKCQDTIDSSKQYLSHVYIINEAVRIGFYCKDLFVYCVRNRMTDNREQQHARKYHSYYLVFKKTKTKIEYVRRLSN